MEVPQPWIDGRWLGFFAELVFPKSLHTGNWVLDLFMDHETFKLTSIGWVTPDTLPFEPCWLETCTYTIV